MMCEDQRIFVIEKLFLDRDDFQLIVTGIALEGPGVKVSGRVVAVVFYVRERTFKNNLPEAAIRGDFENGAHGGHQVIFFFHIVVFTLYNKEAEIASQINLVA
jgi:hypothetical protein